VNADGGSDAISGFGDRDSLDRTGGSPDLRSGLSGLPARVRPGTYYECRYTSLPQCNASASGRSAQCDINPYCTGAQGLSAAPPGLLK